MQWTLCTITTVWVHTLICFHLYQLSHFTMSCCGFGFTVTTPTTASTSVPHTVGSTQGLLVLCVTLSPAAEGFNLNPSATFCRLSSYQTHVRVCVCAWPHFLLELWRICKRTLKVLPALLTSDYSIQMCGIMSYICFLIPHVVVFSVKILNAVGVFFFFVWTYSRFHLREEVKKLLSKVLLADPISSQLP